MEIYDVNGIMLIDVDVDNESVRYKTIKGENTLTLRYSLPEHVELPTGAFCFFKNEKYTLMTPEDITMHHRRSFQYNVVLHAEYAMSRRFMFINPVDGRIKFPMTAKPIEHLQMFVDNMNMRDSGWELGECIEQNEIEMAYSHITCYEALSQLADKLDLDFWFDGKTVSLGKLESNKETPLELSYGGDGEGLDAEIKRVNFSEAAPIDVLFVQGSESNIDLSTYGSKELHLPVEKTVNEDGSIDYAYKTIGYDGVHFEDEEGFDAARARYYTTDNKGLSIRRSDIDVPNDSEASLDCSDIEPSKDETVISVVEVDKEKHYYDIVFSSDVDYRDYQIKGENPSVVFQNGMLAGKEFDVATNTSGKIILYEEGENWRMELKPQDIDGITMPDPDTGYMPVEGNTFRFFGIQLPEEYLSNNETKTGAEWEMFRMAVRYMYDNENPQYTFTANLNELYAKRNWDRISSKIELGSYVSFSDRSIQEEPVVIRIVGIKEKVNSPYSPQLDLSNASVSGGLLGTITRIESEDVIRDEKDKQARQYTKRRWQEAKETLSLLQGAFKNFSEGINPLTVQTMAMLVGDESLQFRFISATGSSMTSVNPVISYNADTRTMNVGRRARLMHMTLGIDDITAPSSKTISDYKTWTMMTWTSQTLDDGSKSYYLYAKVSSKLNTGTYTLSETAIDMYADEDFYYFLVGILNAEYEGNRQFVSLYGFTEILPGQISTDIIRSADGNAVLDLVNGLLKFGNNVGLSGASEGEKNLRMWAGREQSDSETAPFRLYDDGSAFAAALALLNGCTIGDGIRIEDGEIVIDTPHIHGSIRIGEQGIEVTGDYGASIGNCTGAAIQGLAKGVPASCPNPTQYGATSIAIEGTASDEDLAFLSRGGKFAGLRTAVKVINASAALLTDTDFNILVPYTSGSYTIELPGSPLDGQEYWLETFGADVTVDSSKRMWSHYGAKYETSHLFSSRGVIRFKYYKEAEIWTYTWVESL